MTSFGCAPRTSLIESCNDSITSVSETSSGIETSKVPDAVYATVVSTSAGSTPYISANSVVMSATLSAGTSLVTAPEIDTAETAPVMVGNADGVEDTGAAVGVTLGVSVGAAVMKISQNEMYTSIIP